AFAKAAHVVELDVENNRLVMSPVEPRAAIARHDPATGIFHLQVSGASVHAIRDQLAGSVFNIAKDQLHVTAPDVGGGFGGKNFAYAEYAMILWAARTLGRPVRWLSERAEDFVTTAQARANHTRGRLALDADGNFLALDVATIADIGAYLSA